jgi:hypothetical protein
MVLKKGHLLPSESLLLLVCLNIAPLSFVCTWMCPRNLAAFTYPFLPWQVDYFGLLLRQHLITILLELRQVLL